MIQMQDSLQRKGWTGIVLVLVLMIFNWGLEARKWQKLVKPLERISFMRAFSAILSGVSLSINTPNRIGEYGGRVLYLRNHNKLKAIAATIVGSFSQLIVTVIFGLIGMIYYINNFTLVKGNSYFPPNFWEKILFGVLLVICVLTILLYFRLQIILAVFEKVRFLRKAKVFVQIIVKYSSSELRYLLLLSALRYMVFSAQYLILLDALGLEFMWWQAFLLNSVIYLVMAVVPTIAIAELGLRGKVSIYFLGLISSNTAAIIAATVGIWLINLVLPAVLGSVLLLGVKIFKEK
ncbi:MAG TPA: lysylphosphatidylglycerol synthase domain-containing protein [Chitinophaga sp.]|uniref:lysylphosphatidylglycerol synthase domain-containing protein n=1 Tax=Chitinophaga sp. TaxID=1869181 RepID=UPI002BB9A758|nr:lysylphosphatidylglycerol synthase domain-containing protein [Chitinophaga sp.]HVI46231.1 lysylphosphatidylglycerol synthase domain-containing protein [Chitinophaga sp.]